MSYIPLEFWFNKVYKKPITIDEAIDNKFINKVNLPDNEFCEKLEETLCTDWYKDFDNEFYTSNDSKVRDNAWDLTYNKAENEFIKLRCDYSDDIIFYAIDISCKIRCDNIESVRKLCKMISDKLVLLNFYQKR